LVIERERLKEERDALLYFIDGTNDILYERWFYCEDLVTQLGPLVKEFLSSEEYKTGKPNISKYLSKIFFNIF
jgi:3-hydroxyanthranilate 3,4-dioxygenase